MDVSNWIESGCEAEDLTLEELAERIDEEESDLQSWADGESTPSVQAMNKLKEVIGEPDGIGGDEGEPDGGGRENGDPDIDFEDKLWEAANQLRNNLDAAVYKHVVLGLIFLKYISDAFESRREELEREKYADPEDPRMNTGRNTSSGCRRRRAGPPCRPMPNSPTSASV